MPQLDALGRPPITPDIRGAIKDAFAVVPPGKSSAVIAIVDEHGGRVHAAIKVNETWKVGAVLDLPFHGRPTGFVGVMAAW